MIKSFKGYLLEMISRDDLNISGRGGKRSTFVNFGSILLGKKFDQTNRTKLFKKGDYTVYQEKRPANGLDIFVTDKQNKIVIELILKKDGAMHYVDTVVSISKDYKAHELYRDIITKGIVNGLTAHEQSIGGRNIWNKLSQFSNIEVFGWDPYHRQAINLGNKLPDEIETHVSNRNTDYDKDTNLTRRMKLVAIKKIK